MADALIIDSSVATCMSIERMLREEGYKSQMCLPTQAKQFLQDNEYHVVITSVTMSGVNGVEISSFIREDLPDEKKGIAVIALCDADQNIDGQSEEEAVKSIANCALYKPVDREKLMQKMFEFVPVL